MPGQSRYLSTAQVAEALGLSVTTVKRWVDDGVLPAHKTAGGHRKVLATDVLRVMRDSDLPEADIGKLFPRPRAADLSELSEVRRQLNQALETADQQLARSLVLGAYQQGYPVHTLADEVFGPVLVGVGDAWAAGQIGIMHEHRATQLLVSILYELQTNLRTPADRDRPIAVGGAPEGDPTLVPTLLAKLVLLDAGWDAVNLGPHTPTSAFVAAMDDLKPRLVWLCVTHLDVPEDFLRDYQELYREADARGVAVAVGGRALGRDMRGRMVYSSFGDGMGHLAAFARTIYQRPGVPKKGRPPKGERRGTRPDDAS